MVEEDIILIFSFYSNQVLPPMQQRVISTLQKWKIANMVIALLQYICALILGDIELIFLCYCLLYILWSLLFILYFIFP